MQQYSSYDHYSPRSSSLECTTGSSCGCKGGEDGWQWVSSCEGDKIGGTTDNSRGSLGLQRDQHVVGTLLRQVNGDADGGLEGVTGIGSDSCNTVGKVEEEGVNVGGHSECSDSSRSSFKVYGNVKGQVESLVGKTTDGSLLLIGPLDKNIGSKAVLQEEC